LQASLRQFPVVALVGPRQVGKTTPARALVGKSGWAVYLDMERPSDAESYLEPLADGLVILDEVQRCAGSGKCSRTITANCGMPRKLPAAWRRVQDHRCHRIACRDCQDPYAPGLAGQSPAARAGAFSGSLILKETRVPQRG